MVNGNGVNYYRVIHLPIKLEDDILTFANNFMLKQGRISLPNNVDKFILEQRAKLVALVNDERRTAVAWK